MIRTVRKVISSNLYLLIGLLIGLYVSSLISLPQCKRSESTNIAEQKVALNLFGSNTSVKTVTNKATSSKKPKPVRPRYYSTELGIREKIFVGIVTSEEKINSHAIPINATIGHLVDKVKFFITAQNKLKTKHNLTGIVGFTDTRHRYRPFQIVKYIGDTFLLDYDYYFLINDYSYINIRALKDIVNKISVSMNVYLGTAIPDSSFCSLDSGILISNSVLKAMRKNLEWCVLNAVSDDHGENFGRCVYHSTNLNCQESVQEQKIPTFKIRHSELQKNLALLSTNEHFSSAVTVYPILESKDFYLLNAFFAQRRLKQLKLENDELSVGLMDSWPPGHRPGNKPDTRFDVPKQNYFNMTHMFFPSDFVNIQKHSKADVMDIQTVVEAIKAKVSYENPNKYQFRRFINGYRTFDLSRGMDYTMDIGFRDLTTGKEVIKRFEVCKPLGKVEFVPVPYVTENTRVIIILPVQESEEDAAKQFLMDYIKIAGDTKDKTFLMLVLLYQYDSPSKNKEDVFYELKNAALKLLNRNVNEDARVAWVSIRLPYSSKVLTLEEYNVLNYAVVDLALRKVGLESLNFVLDVYATVSIELLNRVRMNTIVGSQVFSPIPFRQYNPEITETTKFDVSQKAGHFDREQYKYISFYGKDYVNARKKSQHIVPLIKTDNDISRVLSDKFKKEGNIFEMFVKFSDDLHSMRATEPSLKVKYHEEITEGRCNLFLGSTSQLATLIFSKRDGIVEMY